MKINGWVPFYIKGLLKVKLYDNNIFGIQDGLDKAGQKVDEWWSSGKEAVSDFFENPGESIASGLDAINPFS